MLDRFDIRIDVPRVPVHVMTGDHTGEPSDRVAHRVSQARSAQSDRSGETVITNAELEGDRLTAVAKPDQAGQSFLNEAAEKLRYTARGYHRVLRLCRTLADLDGSDAVRKVHVAEAVSYRRALA